jgi:hypothetical protein
MKPTLRNIAFLSAFFAITSLAVGDTWTDGGLDGSWSNPDNWTDGVPTNTTAVIFADPISVVGVDTGGSTTVASITVDTGTSAFQITQLVGESLVVNGNFINNSTNAVDVSIDYTVGASATLDGPIDFNSLLTLGTRTASLLGTIDVGLVTLQLNNATGTGYGRFSLGSGSTLTFTGGLNSVSFAASSTYTGVLNDTFTLVGNSGGSIVGLTASIFDVSTLPTLSGFLTWDTSNLATGTLSVVPEPSTWLLLTAGLTSVIVFRRRRS